MKRMTCSPFSPVVGLFAALAVACLAAPVADAGGSAKVKVCHIPPGNPDNFHTITISERALAAHLAHGDLPGSCSESCEMLCDDGNACTIDACDPETEMCLDDRPQVDCDDGNLCTVDTCDPIAGCQSAPMDCDDGDACTIDACNPADGSCVGTPIDCGLYGVCLPETSQCDYPCDGITCEPISQCHQAGECVLPGECLPGDPVPKGTACDDGNPTTSDDQCENGACVGTAVAVCPCFSAARIQGAASQCSSPPTFDCSTGDPFYLFLGCSPGGTVPPGVLGVYIAQASGGGFCQRDDHDGLFQQSGLTVDEYQACVDEISDTGYCSPEP